MRGPLLTPVREPAGRGASRAERLREWKVADKELQAQLPPCDQCDIMHADDIRDGTWPTPLNPVYKHRNRSLVVGTPCECERCQFEADRGRDKRSYVSRTTASYGLDIPYSGPACDGCLLNCR